MQNLRWLALAMTGIGDDENDNVNKADAYDGDIGDDKALWQCYVDYNRELCSSAMHILYTY